MVDVKFKLIEHYSELSHLGYTPVGLFLQGSQNYNLHYSNSDVDTKAIVLPSLDDIILNKTPVSTTHIMPDNSHLDIKDIRVMFNTIKKQNINFVEILFTDYKIINPIYESLFEPMLTNNEAIAHYNNYSFVNCMCGMALEKYKALKHPYPNCIDDINNYGYCRKELHHILRIKEFMERYIAGEPYSSCLISKQRDYLVGIKSTNILPLSEAEALAAQSINEIKSMKDKYINTHPLQINKSVDFIMNQVTTDIIKYHFREELMNGKN